MEALSRPCVAAERVLLPLIFCNGVTVSTLYSAQSVIGHAAAEFGPSSALQLMPGATLAGYAVGVALLAALCRDLTSPRGLLLHSLLLGVSLCAVATAPAPAIAAGSCLFVGLGCSLTQRLLACATSAVPSQDRARTIGSIVAAGLVGILLARALVPIASASLGWRSIFLLSAFAAAACGTVAAWALAGGDIRPTLSDAPLPTALSLWRREIVLRRAALQQAVVFAAFNMGWALFPRLLAAGGSGPHLAPGIVAALGACSAIIAGRVCSAWHPSAVARAGLAIVALAALAFALTGARTTGCSIEMALLDMGTQVALVANQARAQAIASSPAMRGRLAAIVTTIGFAGGAIGAAIGNMLV